MFVAALRLSCAGALHLAPPLKTATHSPRRLLFVHGAFCVSAQDKNAQGMAAAFHMFQLICVAQPLMLQKNFQTNLCDSFSSIFERSINRHVHQEYY